MIQRLSVSLSTASDLPEVRLALVEIGFPDDAIRVWHNQDSDFVNIHAYRDGDVDTMPRLESGRLEEYAVMIWSRIGSAGVTLTEFDIAGPPIEGDHDAWQAD